MIGEVLCYFYFEWTRLIQDIDFEKTTGLFLQTKSGHLSEDFFRNVDGPYIWSMLSKGKKKKITFLANYTSMIKMMKKFPLH